MLSLFQACTGVTYVGGEDPNRSDGACVVDPDGSLSNARLHEEMTEGVDDSHIRARTRA